MTLEGIEALRPYLNPDYWNGHTIGHGETVDSFPKLNISSRQQRVYKKMLLNRLSLMQQALALEKYGEGEAFDAENYEVGTVVLLRDEVLRGRLQDMPEGEDAESLRGQALPARPLDTSPSFDKLAGTSQRVEAGQLSYFTAARFGIVGVGSDKKKSVYTTSTGTTHKREGGRVYSTTTGLHMGGSPIKVGETLHVDKRGSETISRVNLLEVIAYGEASRQKDELKALVGRLAVGNAE